MGGRNGIDTRKVTLGVACVSIASTGLLMLIWVPIAATAEDGFRPMGAASILLLLLAAGTVPGFVAGLVQTALWRPRVYGLISVAVSALPYAALRLSTWLLLDLRGVHMGS
jgi:hypothetical protein